jgi:hypothetical protein
VLGVEAHTAVVGFLHKAMGFYRANISHRKLLADSLQTLKKTAVSGFYKNYDARYRPPGFRSAFIPLYMQQGEQVVAPKMNSLMYSSGNNVKSWGNNVFANSMSPEVKTELTGTPG